MDFFSSSCELNEHLQVRESLSTTLPNMEHGLSQRAHAQSYVRTSRATCSLASDQEDKYSTKNLDIKSINSRKMWSTVSTVRSSLKHLARIARHTPSIRTFGSVTNQVSFVHHVRDILRPVVMHVLQRLTICSLLYRELSQRTFSPEMDS